jgi:hypothetical protein
MTLSWCINQSIAQGERFYGGVGQGYTMSDTGLDAIILPVAWKSFTVSQSNDYITLYWATREEINNDYFIIQRSADGLNFNDVGKVSGAGNTSIAQRYSALDRNPHFGQNYYRLKQVDYDGGFDLSEMRSIYFNPDAHANRLRIDCVINGVRYPVWLEHRGMEGLLTLRLIDIMGKVRYSRQLPSDQLNLTDPFIMINKPLATGIYSLVFTGSGSKATKKILVR